MLCGFSTSGRGGTGQRQTPSIKHVAYRKGIKRREREKFLIWNRFSNSESCMPVGFCPDVGGPADQSSLHIVLIPEPTQSFDDSS